MSEKLPALRMLLHPQCPLTMRPSGKRSGSATDPARPTSYVPQSGQFPARLCRTVPDGGACARLTLDALDLCGPGDGAGLGWRS
jgi:hypothetical protein